MMKLTDSFGIFALAISGGMQAPLASLFGTATSFECIWRSASERVRCAHFAPILRSGEVIRVLAIIAAAAAGCCSIAHAEPSKQPDAVRIRWLHDCGSASEQPYFSIEVHADGLVRYDGQNGTKVIGIRESRITAAAARRLRAQVLSFIGERKALKDSEKEFNLEYFCLEAAVLRGDKAVAANARRSDARSSRALLQEIGKRIGPAQWTCPASHVSGPALIVSGYCDEKPAAISLTLAGRTACDLSQELFVYEDGTLYSLAYRGHGRRDARDRYYQIDPRAVADLVETIRPLARGWLEIISDPPGSVSKVSYRYQPEDVQTIRNRLAALANIEWMATYDAADCEQFPGPSSAIHLREDLDVASDP